MLTSGNTAGCGEAVGMPQALSRQSLRDMLPIGNTRKLWVNMRDSPAYHTAAAAGPSLLRPTSLGNATIA